MNRRPRAIAIDGAVAVGKSTVGRLLSRRLGYRFVDTGNMYRALAWKALRQGLAAEDEAGLARLAAATRLEVPASSPTGNSLLVDGEEVSGELRQPEVERLVSLVARIPQVRQAMVAQQRDIAGAGAVVMAGRDIGTVVLPEAEVKVFLQASPQERARRRYRELGGEQSYETILEELEKRDQMDSSRPVSPLRPAPSAIILDTETIPAEEVVNRICSLWNEG